MTDQTNPPSDVWTEERLATLERALAFRASGHVDRELPHFIAAYRVQQERIAGLRHICHEHGFLMMRHAMLETAARAVLPLLWRGVEWRDGTPLTARPCRYCLMFEGTGHVDHCPVGALAALLEEDT